MSLIIVEAYVYNSGQKRADRLCVNDQIIWNNLVYTVMNAQFVNDGFGTKTVQPSDMTMVETSKADMTVQIHQMQPDGINLVISCNRGTYFTMIDIAIKNETVKAKKRIESQPAFSEGVGSK